jgi:hypothetical protein
MGARPSPQSPASIQTTTSSVAGLPWIVMTSVLCRGRSVENRPGMPSTWSKWPCVSKSRSSLLKPAPPRSNWRCVPFPQSTMMRCPPASTRRPGWLRSADGTLAEVPRNVRSNIVGPVLSVLAANCHAAGVQAYYISDQRRSPRPRLKKPLLVFLLLVFVPIFASPHDIYGWEAVAETGRPRTDRAPASCLRRPRTPTPWSRVFAALTTGSPDD